MSVKFKGSNVLKKFEKNLKKKAEEASGKYQLTEVLNDSYISSISRFSSLSEMLENNPEPIFDVETFEKADQAILDNFISKETQFSNWQEMLTDASAKLFASKF